METKLLFSIVVPVYNVEQYLDKCLQSLTHQTFKNFEVILVDDGSTDSSGKICDKYAEKYDLPQTGGSDIHSTNLTYGGMAFARPLKNIQDFQTAVINREGIVLPGERLSNVK